MFYIYELIDPNTNETRYIGQTVNPYERFYNHLSEAKKRKSHKNKWLNKLLKQNQLPILNVIDEIESDVYFWEKFYIELYKSWNVRLTNTAVIILGGGDTFTQDLNKEKRRKRMSEIMKQRYSDPAEREKTRVKCKKAWENEELLKKQSEHSKQTAARYKENTSKLSRERWQNDEYRKKHSDRLREKWKNDKEYVQKITAAHVAVHIVPIEQLDAFGNVIATFPSISDAARYFNIRPQGIMKVLNHIRKSIHGLYFRRIKK